MTLAYTLARQQRPARAIAAEAKTTFGAAAGVRLIRRSQLEITVDVEGVTEAELDHAAELAGRNCPVSNSLRIAGADLDVHAHLKAS
jgi:organic hydroperoxide reductase OsmC/OhrA